MKSSPFIPICIHSPPPVVFQWLGLLNVYKWTSQVSVPSLPSLPPQFPIFSVRPGVKNKRHKSLHCSGLSTVHELELYIHKNLQHVCMCRSPKQMMKANILGWPIFFCFPRKSTLHGVAVAVANEPAMKMQRGLPSHFSGWNGPQVNKLPHILSHSSSELPFFFSLSLSLRLLFLTVL